MKYEQIAQAIIDNIGGLTNISHVTNCMTRVRLTLNDDSLVNNEKLKAIVGVLGLVNDDTLQVIVGPGKSTTIADLINQQLLNGTAVDPLEKAEIARQKAKKITPMKAILRSIANIFVPILPGLIAAGTLMGINNIITKSADAYALTHHILASDHLSAGQVVLQSNSLLQLSVLLGLIASSLFGFLAIYVGVNAGKEFNSSPILGGMIGAITIAPQLTLLGLHPGQGGLIGVIFAVWLLSKVEKQVRRFIPDIIDVVATPILTIMIMTAILLLGIMPAAGVLSDFIIQSLLGLLHQGGMLTGFVLSAIFPFLISLGLHHGLIPIHMELINATGTSQLFAIQIMSNSGMVGAATAVLLLTKDPIMKRVARGAIPTSILAVGEPTIFGVNIPAGFAFITGSIGAGFGGMMIVFLGVSANGVGAAGMSAIPMIADGKYLQYIFSWLVGACAAFIITYLYGKYIKYE